MKNLFLIALTSILILGCTPRRLSYLSESSPKYASKYADKLDEGATLVRSWYHYTVEKTQNGNYISKTYFPDTRQITHYTTFSDADLKTRNGLCREYWDNGDLRFSGNYTNGKREGTWVYYNNTSKETGEYKVGNKEGKWVETDTAGILRSEYNYLADKKHGAFKVWDKTGDLSKEGIYENDEIASEKDYGGEVEIYKIAEEQPHLKGCENADSSIQKKCSDEKMLMSIYATIKYPALAREMGIDGTTITSFVVEKDGSLSNIVVKRGLCKEIKAEVERVVRNMPQWNPGKQDGKAVRVQFYLPVKFKLE